MIHAHQQRISGKLIEVCQPQQMQAVKISTEIEPNVDFEPMELPF